MFVCVYVEEHVNRKKVKKPLLFTVCLLKWFWFVRFVVCVNFTGMDYWTRGCFWTGNRIKKVVIVEIGQTCVNWSKMTSCRFRSSVGDPKPMLKAERVKPSTKPQILIWQSKNVSKISKLLFESAKPSSKPQFMI